MGCPERCYWDQGDVVTGSVSLLRQLILVVAVDPLCLDQVGRVNTAVRDDGDKGAVLVAESCILRQGIWTGSVC